MVHAPHRPAGRRQRAPTTGMVHPSTPPGGHAAACPYDGMVHAPHRLGGHAAASPYDGMVHAPHHLGGQAREPAHYIAQPGPPRRVGVGTDPYMRTVGVGVLHEALCDPGYGRGMPSPLQIRHHPTTHHGRARGSVLPLHGNLRRARDFVRTSIDLCYGRLYVGTRPFKMTCHAGSRAAFSNMQQVWARLLPRATPAMPAARLNAVPGVPAGVSRSTDGEPQYAPDMEVSRW
jgi:hypothetical protein